jgi:hypothetical protein
MLLLFVLLLLFAVVPLFETLDDLRNASATMDTLLGSEWYRNHIQTHHGGVQEVMIGECVCLGELFQNVCRFCVVVEQMTV